MKEMKYNEGEERLTILFEYYKQIRTFPIRVNLFFKYYFGVAELV